MEDKWLRNMYISIFGNLEIIGFLFRGNCMHGIGLHGKLDKYRYSLHIAL